MHAEIAFIILFCVATTVALVARRFQVPYTVALVIAGLGIGELGLLEAPHLTKELLFAVFLPGLLFEAAFHVDYAAFRRNSRTILSLAVPGVVAAIALTGVLTTLVVQGLALDPTFSIGFGLVFGAIIAATDPIAVTALFRTMHVPHRLSLLVEGESLLNDGTAIVLFTLVLSFVLGEQLTGGALLASFLRITVGGALVGVVIGAAVSRVTMSVDEPMIEITLTVIAAYGSFVAAEQYHLSGVIATVAAGMVCGNYGRRHGMSPTTRLSVEAFWTYLAFALNSIVFLLIGFDVSLAALGGYWREILVASVAVIAARFGVVTAVTTALRGTSEGVSRDWSTVLAWGGIRGALSIVLALGLPRDLPHRDQLVTMTVGVVLTSILVQGLTMAPLLRRLGLVARAGSVAYERRMAELRVASAGLAEVEALLQGNRITVDDARRLRAPYQVRMEGATAGIAALEATTSDLALRRRELAVRHLLTVERDRLTSELRDESIASEVHDDLQKAVAGRLVRLDERAYDEPAELLIEPSVESPAPAVDSRAQQ